MPPVSIFHPLRCDPLVTAPTPTLIDPWVVLQIGQSRAYLKALSKLYKPTNLLYRNNALQLLFGLVAAGIYPNCHYRGHRHGTDSHQDYTYRHCHCCRHHYRHRIRHCIRNCCSHCRGSSLWHVIGDLLKGSSSSCSALLSSLALDSCI